MAGPGVASNGLDTTTWSDHADIVPTMMSLTGLKTDYQPDGRVITAIQSLTTQRDALASQMRDVLDGTSVGHEEQLIRQAQDLIAQAAALAAS
jgi:hypothetical protein